MRRECNKCEGSGTQRGPLGKAFKVTCDVCKGEGFVELGNVVKGNFQPQTDGDADDMLRQAIGNLDAVVIVGYDKDGNEYYSSNIDHGAHALWHLQRASMHLLNIVDTIEEGDL